MWFVICSFIKLDPLFKMCFYKEILHSLPISVWNTSNAQIPSNTDNIYLTAVSLYHNTCTWNSILLKKNIYNNKFISNQSHHLVTMLIWVRRFQSCLLRTEYSSHHSVYTYVVKYGYVQGSTQLFFLFLLLINEET